MLLVNPTYSCLDPSFNCVTDHIDNQDKFLIYARLMVLLGLNRTVAELTPRVHQSYTSSVKANGDTVVNIS